MIFNPGDIVVKKSDLGIPGVTLREYSVVRVYRKYGQNMIDVVGLSNHNGRCSTMYPEDLFMLYTEDRKNYLLKFHGRKP